MPEFNADLLPRLLIQVAVKAIAVTPIDRCGVASELLITLAGVGRLQFMKALQSVFMQRFAGGKHGLLQERGVAFVSGQQVAAASRRRMTSQLQRRLWCRPRLAEALEQSAKGFELFCGVLGGLDRRQADAATYGEIAVVLLGLADGVSSPLRVNDV